MNFWSQCFSKYGIGPSDLSMEMVKKYNSWLHTKLTESRSLGVDFQDKRSASSNVGEWTKGTPAPGESRSSAQSKQWPSLVVNKKHERADC